MKKIQRTLIVTGDGLAGAVGERLAALFAGDGGPAEVVAVLPADEADFVEALKRIARISTREKAAEKGWILDRLEEAAVIQVVDTAALYPVEETAGRISEAAHRELRLTTTNLILAIVPELEVEARLLELTGRHPVVAVSPVCEQGLMDTETLTATCARLIHVLVTTPLRDSLAWLAEVSGHPGQAQVNSMGLAVWAWSPAAERERLAWRWVDSALGQWRRPVSENEESAVAEQARRRLESLEPEQIARFCTPRLPPPVEAPAWPYPQPWRVQEYFQNDGQVADRGEAVEAALGRLVQDLRPAPLLDVGREILEEQPVAGPSRLRMLVKQLETGLEALGDRLADREDVQAERIAALTERQRVLEETLAQHLSDWPQPRLGSWFRVSANPWRWPGLVWKYWQMRNMALALNQVKTERRQWERQQQITAATAGLYHGLEKETARFSGKVEELEDMLGALAREVEGRLETAGETTVTDVLYWQLVEGPGAEAERAAAVIGGLGQQLSRPDDAVLESLFSAGLERMEEVQSLSAADILLLLYPTPDGLAGWWGSQLEAAAPLWRDDQGLAPASGQADLVLVCGAGALALGQALGEQASDRWIETDDLQRLTLLRVRGPMVIDNSS